MKAIVYAILQFLFISIWSITLGVLSCLLSYLLILWTLDKALGQIAMEDSNRNDSLTPAV